MNPARVRALEIEGHSGPTPNTKARSTTERKEAMMNANANPTLLHNLKYVSLLASLAALFLLCAARA